MAAVGATQPQETVRQDDALQERIELVTNEARKRRAGDGAEALGREQSQRRFVDRRPFERVDRTQFHDRLQALGDRRLAAADGTQQVEDLLLLLEALRRVLEEGHDLLDRVLHAVELAEVRDSA